MLRRLEFDSFFVDFETANSPGIRTVERRGGLTTGLARVFALWSQRLIFPAPFFLRSYFQKRLLLSGPRFEQTFQDEMKHFLLR
jgi:hypothetical protein